MSGLWRRFAWLPLCLIAGLLSLALGQDASWDLQNYHFYNAYALLHPARWHDIIIAQSQSFLNPILDLPLYGLTAIFPKAPRVVAVFMALPFAALAYFTIRIAGRLFGSAGSGRWAGAVAVLLGLSGTATVSQIGLSTDEVPVAALIIAALDFLLLGIERGAAGGLRPILTAGLLAGLAAGAKLTAAPYALGLAAACLAGLPPRSWPRGLATLGIAGLAGALLTGGGWMLHLWRLYGNPIFPFDNQLFKSPWAGPWGYNDTRFFPRSLGQALLFPFYWAGHNTMVVAETPFADSRLAASMLTGAAALIAALARRTAPPPPWRAAILFTLVSYVLWEALFSIYRYAIPLEVMSGLLVTGAITALLRSRPATAAGAAAVIAAAIAVASDYPVWGRIPFQDRAVPVSVPPIAPGTLVVSSDADAMSFVAALAPAGVTFAGGNSNFYLPDSALLWRQLSGTIQTWKGPIEIMEPAGGDPAGRAALAANFSLVASHQCQPIRAAWPAGQLQLCPASRAGAGPDDQPPVKLDFGRGGNGAPDAGAGWETPEDWGMWSVAPDAFLNISLNPRNAKPLLLTVLCFSIPDATSPGRHVDVYAGGNLIAHWSLNRFPETFTATIPATPGRATLPLRFHTLDPLPPPYAGAASPPIKLGIALQHLSIQEALN